MVGKGIFTLLIGLAAVLILAPQGQAAQTSAPYSLGAWENQQLLFLEARSTSSGPFLSANAETGGTNGYIAADLASGATATLGAYSGTRPPAIEFKLDAPLDGPRWLNLSKPIVGALFFQTPLSAATQRESVAIQVELWVGGILAGGDHFVYGANVVTQNWVPMYFKFRPEVAVVLPAQEVTFKVYRLSGVQELTIGTGGSQQSYVELRYFDADPLSGTIYLEGAKLVAPRPPTPPPRYLPLFGLGLLAAPFLIRRRPALLVVLALLAPAMGGCLTGAGDSAETDPDESGAPIATASVNQTTDEELRASGRGAVEGYVRDGDNGGIPIRAAHVAFLGTNLFSRTDPRGYFEFGNMTPGSFVLRVDAERFNSFEQTIEVDVGTRTWVNVSLVRPGSAGGDKVRIHGHDLWGDDLVRPLFESTFLPTSYPYDLPPSTNTWQAYWACPPTACETLIPVPVGTLILPGTSLVELTLDWSTTGPAPKELQLRVVTSSNRTLDQLFVMRGPKVAFRIPIFPSEADYGHQTGTDWAFYIRIPPVASLYHPHGQPEFVGGTVRATAKIHKGVVPLEPAHRTFWNGAESMNLLPPTARVNSLVCCGAPYYPGQITWQPPKGSFVPPGTKEMKGTFQVTQQGQGHPYPWKLVYRGADSPVGAPWRNIPLTNTGIGAYTFAFDVPPEQTDQFYQTASKWMFAIDDDIPTDARPLLQPNHGQGQTYTLAATVHKDPSYTE